MSRFSIKDMTRDALNEEAFIKHLGEINDSNAVVASEDILNQNGIPIVKKGSRLDDNIIDRILQHKLSKPIDNSIEIENTFDAVTLYKRINAMIQSNPDLEAIHEIHEGEDMLQEIMFAGLHMSRKIAMKLTVMDAQLPEIFEKALFTSWFSALIAKQMNLSAQEIKAAFFAGLLHDIGFVHIDPKIVHKKGKLEAHEWRSIMAHVVVGKLVTEGIPNLDPLIPLAILEHHERADGTGYPAGKPEECLNKVSMVVAMADSLQALRFGQFAGAGRQLGDAIPWLQLNCYHFGFDVYTATIRMIQNARLKMTVIEPNASIEEYAAYLQSRNQLIAEVVHKIESLSSQIRELSVRKSIDSSSITKMLSNTLYLMHSCGLVNDAFTKNLLGTLRDDHEDRVGILEELNRVDLMQQEVIWQLRHIERMVKEFQDRTCSEKIEGCDEVLALIDSLRETIDACSRYIAVEDTPHYGV